MKWENILLLSLWGERNLCLSAGKNEKMKEEICLQFMCKECL
jgi:hypothetical protein